MQSPLSPTSVPVDPAAVGASPIRVLHCIPTLASGGAETQLKRLAEWAVRKGVASAVLARMAPAVREELAAAGVRPFPIADGRHFDPRQLVAIQQAVTAFRPTVIQTWLTQMDVLGGVVALARRIPWIISERTSPPCYSPNWRNRVRARLGGHADRIIANSAHGLDVWPHHPHRLVIGNGIDLAAIAAAPPDTLRATAPFRGQPVVLSVSRLVPEKKVDVLIRAVAAVRDRLPGSRLVVVGDGPERPGLEALAYALGIAEHVGFAGNQPQPLAWYRSADLFVSASLFEGLPNAVLEAAAAGLPLVLSDIPMHRSFVGDGARYVALDDVHGMAEAIAQQATVPAAERRPAIATDLLAAYDIGHATDRYIDVYRELTVRDQPALRPAA